MEHIEKVQNTIDYIEDNLSSDLTIDEIAKYAGFSKWHFQMIFSSVVGESVKDYIRKRRLSNALVSLNDEDSRIIDIALEAGYESQEAFTRAFKGHFGTTPADCRKRGTENFVMLRKPKITYEYLDHLYGSKIMEPKIVKVDAFNVVGYGASFISILSPEKNNHIVIPKIWAKYIPHQSSISNRANRTNFGVCFLKENRAHPDECYYIAGARVSDLNQIPEGMESVTIAAGEYAVFTHKGQLNKVLNNLEFTMNYIYGSWLPKSGRELRDCADFELYDERFNPDSDESEFDIYIPLK